MTTHTHIYIYTCKHIYREAYAFIYTCTHLHTKENTGGWDVYHGKLLIFLFGIQLFLQPLPRMWSLVCSCCPHVSFHWTSLPGECNENGQRKQCCHGRVADKCVLVRRFSQCWTQPGFQEKRNAIHRLRLPGAYGLLGSYCMTSPSENEKWIIPLPASATD